MKKKSFWILEGVLLFLSLVFFLLYGVFPKTIDPRGYWHSLFLGLAICLFLIVLFFLVYVLLVKEKPREVKKGVICPRCKTTYPKEEDHCPNCGEKNPE